MNAPRRPSFLFRDDLGSGTLLGVMLIAVVGLMLAAGASAGNLLICQAKARASADLSAVSSASALRAGAEDPCALAASVATANGSGLVSCEVVGEDVSVRVSVATLVPFAPEVSRAARAGPVACR